MNGRIQTALIALCMLTVTTVGCIGGDGEPAPEAAEPTSSDGPGEAQEPASAGQADGEEASEATERNESSQLVEEVVPIDWQGTTAYGACLPSGPNACTSPPVPLGESDSSMTLQPDGQGVSMALTVTWEATTPATMSLEVMVAPYEACGDNCRVMHRTFVYAAGTSPIEIELDDIALEGNETGYYIGVAAGQRVFEPPVYGSLSLEQPFQATGNLTTLVPG